MGDTMLFQHEIITNPHFNARLNTISINYKDGCLVCYGEMGINTFKFIILESRKVDRSDEDNYNKIWWELNDYWKPKINMRYREIEHLIK